MRTLRPDLHLSLSPNLRLSLAVFFSICSKFHSVIERAFIHSCWLPPLGLLGPPLPHASRQHSQLMITLSLPLSLSSILCKKRNEHGKNGKDKKPREVKEGERGKNAKSFTKSDEQTKIKSDYYGFSLFFTSPIFTRSSPTEPEH